MPSVSGLGPRDVPNLGGVLVRAAGLTAADFSSRDGDEELDLFGLGSVPAAPRLNSELSCLARESLLSPSRLAGMGLGVVLMRPLMVAWPEVMTLP